MSTRVYRPSRRAGWLSWLDDERLAIGSLPTAATLPRLPAAGVTHVINCRTRLQTWFSQDLAVERALLGPDRVAHAPMWDTGRPQPPRRWSAAARFAAEALAADPTAGVLVHCQHGRRRSVLVAYAVLRLRGRDAVSARELICRYRPGAVLVDAYLSSVDRWLTGRDGTPT
jgi:protein-tyrosine phosphatase